MSIATPYRLKSKQAFPLTGYVRADLPYARGRRRYRSYLAMNIHMTQRSIAAGRLLIGIACNAIRPGNVYTPVVGAQIEGQARAHRIPREQVICDEAAS